MADQAFIRWMIQYLLGAWRSEAPGARDRAVLLVAARMRDQRTERYERAVREYLASAAQAGAVDPVVPAMRGYSEQAVRTVLDRHLGWASDPEQAQAEPARLAQAANRVARHLELHIEAAARDLIVDAVDPQYEPDGSGIDLGDDEIEHLMDGRDKGPRQALDDAINEALERDETQAEEIARRGRPVAWARVLTGRDNCWFCVMLASRGPVYATQESAIASKVGARYHFHCDCRAVPVWDPSGWEGKARADAMYAMWLRITEGQRHPLGAWKDHFAQALEEGRDPLDEIEKEPST